MSIKELSDFLKAAERTSYIRRDLTKCLNEKGLIKLAKKYGFNINQDDINGFENSERIEKWFQSSQINPIKNKFNL